MSVACGKGHRHESVDDVRRCYNGEDVKVVQEDYTSGERATRSQVKYLTSLLKVRHLQPKDARSVDQMARREASILIDQVKHFNRSLHGELPIPNGLERDPGVYLTGSAEDIEEQLHNGPFLAERSREPYPDVPAGHYAVLSLTGNNDLDFFRVDRPKDRRWAGRTFVKRVIGGKPDSPVRGPTAVAALKAILKAGPAAAQILYGTEIGRCYKCNRHLTDEASRALGIGPDCRSRAA